MTLIPLFCTGYESGVLDASGGGLATTLNGTAPSQTITAGAARSGGYGMHLALTASAGGFLWNVPVGTTRLVTRFALRMSVLPPTTGIVALFRNHTASVFHVLTVTSTGTLTVQITGGSTGTYAGPIGTGWHYIEMQSDVSGTTWTCDWKVDGVAQTQSSLSGQVADTFNYASQGASGASTYTADFDDFIVGSWTVAGTDWFGDGKVIAQQPGSDGTHVGIANFSPGDAGSAYVDPVTTVYSQVAEALWTTARSTTQSLAQRTISATSYAEIAPVPANLTGQANAVRALLQYSSSGTTANTAACIIRNSTPTADVVFGDLPTAQGGNNGALADYSEATNFFKGVVATKPAAGWTLAEINALRWRLGGAGVVSPIPTWQAVLLEVDWPATSVVIPSSYPHIDVSVGS